MNHYEAQQRAEKARRLAAAYRTECAEHFGITDPALVYEAASSFAAWSQLAQAHGINPPSPGTVRATLHELHVAAQVAARYADVHPLAGLPRG